MAGYISDSGNYCGMVVEEVEFSVNLNKPEIVRYILERYKSGAENPLSELIWQLNYGVITKDEFIERIKNNAFHIDKKIDKTASLFKEA